MDGRLWMLTAVFMMMVVSFPAETSALRCLNCKGCSKFEDSQAVTCPSSADRCLVTISHFNPFLIWSLAKNFLLHIFTSFSFGARLFYSKKKQTNNWMCLCVCRFNWVSLALRFLSPQFHFVWIQTQSPTVPTVFRHTVLLELVVVLVWYVLRSNSFLSLSLSSQLVFRAICCYVYI